MARPSELRSSQLAGQHAGIAWRQCGPSGPDHEPLMYPHVCRDHHCTVGATCASCTLPLQQADRWPEAEHGVVWCVHTGKPILACPLGLGMQEADEEARQRELVGTATGSSPASRTLGP